MATKAWTERAMRMQVQALAEHIEIGVLDDGRMVRRQGDLDDLLYLVPWLSWRNRHGAHIYVRPLVACGSAGVILVDDLDADALRQMSADGVIPVAVVETSPQNHQAWIRVAAAPITTEVATAVARVLARRYGGDMNSAVANHLGRLAGFTNRKERYRDAEGRYPWVRVRVVGQSVAPAAGRVLEEAAALVEEQQVIALERFTLPEGDAVSSLGLWFGQEVRRLDARYAGGADWSRLEYMIVLDLARRYPEVSAAALGRALVEGGAYTRLVERKAGHLADYIGRTVAKALAQVARERTAWKAPSSARRGQHGAQSGEAEA